MKRISHKQITHLDPNWIKIKIESFLREDAPRGDITSGCIISTEKKIHAKMISADDLVFCGKAIIYSLYILRLLRFNVQCCGSRFCKSAKRVYITAQAYAES